MGDAGSGAIAQLRKSGHFFFFFDLPARLSAMATACLVGRPSFLSVLMLEEIAFFDLPFLSGMVPHNLAIIHQYGPLLVAMGHSRVGEPMASRIGTAWRGQRSTSPSWWMWSSLSYLVTLMTIRPGS